MKQEQLMIMFQQRQKQKHCQTQMTKPPPLPTNVTAAFLEIAIVVPSQLLYKIIKIII